MRPSETTIQEVGGWLSPADAIVLAFEASWRVTWVFYLQSPFYHALPVASLSLRWLYLQPLFGNRCGKALTDGPGTLVASVRFHTSSRVNWCPAAALYSKRWSGESIPNEGSYTRKETEREYEVRENTK